MFKKLFSTDHAMMLDDASANQGRGLGALRIAYFDWRVQNDIGAIVAALDRLSNRRLQMIGLRREGLRDTVRDMMLSAEEDREIVQDIIAIIDASADNTFRSRDITPPEGCPKLTGTAAKDGYT